MRNRLIFTVCVIIFALTNVWAEMTAQQLPDYGIVRLQTAPELSYGAYSFEANEVNDKLLLQGVGWDTMHIFTTGAYCNVFDGQSLESTLFDTANIRSLNDVERGTAIHFADGITTLRNAEYDSDNDNLVFSGGATIVEYTAMGDSAFTLQVDTLWLNGFEMEDARVQYSRAVKNIELSNRDTVRYLLSKKFIRSFPWESELRSYVAESATVIRKVKTVRFDTAVERGYAAIAVWEQGDTLGRIELKLVTNFSVDLVFRKFNIHTGRLISEQLIEREVFGGLTARVGLSSGIAYVPDFEIDFSAPAGREVKSKITAYRLSDGKQLWQRYSEAELTHNTRPASEFVRTDSSGNTVLLTYTTSKTLFNPEDVSSFQTEVVAYDGMTGDSLWKTLLTLDTFATLEHNNIAFDVAIRANGKGYVVTSIISESKLDPYRDLRYGYTALFFLDSLGCLAPGCRETSGTQEAIAPYAIRLAPNPVLSNTSIRVILPVDIGNVRYAITNNQGQRIHSSQGWPTEGELSVELPDLVPGLHYLTVWPEGNGNAIVTEGFIVE